MLLDKAGGSGDTGAVQSTRCTGDGLLREPYVGIADCDEKAKERLLCDGLKDWNDYVDSLTTMQSKANQHAEQSEEHKVCIYDWV